MPLTSEEFYARALSQHADAEIVARLLVESYGGAGGVGGSESVGSG